MDDPKRKKSPVPNMEIRNPLEGPVAVIGAGVTGASWAALFASRGRDVRLYDQDRSALEKGLARATKAVRFLVEHEMADPGEADRGMRSLKPAAEISEAVKDAVFVQECVYEDYQVKKAAFERIDRHAPSTTFIATSSSGLSISRIQTAARYPERCLAGHPYNPPHLIPLVEIAPGLKTAPEAIEAARRFYLSVGKTPVILTREVPGYLANRMSAALWREAINLVLDGVASVEDVDKAISTGPGLRWAVMGPHLIYHLGGGEGGIRYHIEHLKSAKEKMWRDLKDWKTLPQETTEALERGLPEPQELENLAKSRDEALVKLLKACQAYPKARV